METMLQKARTRNTLKTNNNMTNKEIAERLKSALNGREYTIEQLVDFIETKCKFHTEGLNGDEYDEYENMEYSFNNVFSFRKREANGKPILK